MAALLSTPRASERPGPAPERKPMPTLPVEDRMLQPFPSPALEAVRRMVLTANSGGPPEEQARVVLRRATESDLGVIFKRLYVAPASFATESLPNPRRFIDADLALRGLSSLMPVVHRELRDLGLSRSYQDLLQTYLESTDFVARVTGFCAILVLTAYLR